MTDKARRDYILHCIESASDHGLEGEFERAAYYQRAATVSLLFELVDGVAALRADLAKRGPTDAQGS